MNFINDETVSYSFDNMISSITGNYQLKTANCAMKLKKKPKRRNGFQWKMKNFIGK